MFLALWWGAAYMLLIQDGKDWLQATAAAGWSGRLAAGICVFNDKIWILGGTEDYYYGDETSLKNDVWWSEDGTNWTRATADAGWAPRGYLRAVTLGDRMYVLGGGSYVFNGDEPGNPTGLDACPLRHTHTTPALGHIRTHTDARTHFV